MTNKANHVCRHKFRYYFLYPEMIKSPGLFFRGLCLYFLLGDHQRQFQLLTDGLDESKVTYIKKSFNISSDGKILIVHLLL